MRVRGGKTAEITFAQHGLGPPTPATAAAAAAAGGASREEAGSGGPAAMVPRRDSEGGEGFRVRAERCGAGAQRARGGGARR